MSDIGQNRGGGGIRKGSNLEHKKKSDMRGGQNFFKMFFKSAFANF